MMLKDLVMLYDWPEVKNEFLHLYPDDVKDLSGYEMAFEELKVLYPIETRMRICIERFKEDGEEFYDISGKDGTKNKEQEEWRADWEKGDEEVSWAIEFEDWQKWLGMEFDEETIKNYIDLEILVHCLYEMTWNGYTADEVHERSEAILGEARQNLEEYEREKNKNDQRG